MLPAGMAPLSAATRHLTAQRTPPPPQDLAPARKAAEERAWREAEARERVLGPARKLAAVLTERGYQVTRPQVRAWFGLGSVWVWVRFGFGLGSVWVLFGFCLGSVWVLFGFGAGGQGGKGHEGLQARLSATDPPLPGGGRSLPLPLCRRPCLSRRLMLGAPPSAPPPCARPPQVSVGARRPAVDAAGAVHWPVLLMYPETLQQDVVEDWMEDDTVADHLDVVRPGYTGRHD
jgi:hypothetical protein